MLPNGAWRCRAGDDVMSILGLLAAPRPLFPGLCSLFPWLAFSKGGLTALVLAGARARPGGGAERPGPGEAALCTRQGITSSRSGWSPTRASRLQARLHSQGQRVEWKIGRKTGKKSWISKFFPFWGFLQNVLGLQTSSVMLSWLKNKGVALLLPHFHPSLDESYCQPRIPSYPLRESIFQTIQKV